MKKRILSLLVVLAVLLAGCSRKPSPEETLPQPTTLPMTEATQPVPTEPPVTVPEPAQKQLQQFPGNIWSLSGTDSFCAVLYETPKGTSELACVELPSGRILGQKAMGNSASTVQACDSGLALMDWSSGSLMLYDTALTVQRTWEELWPQATLFTADQGLAAILDGEILMFLDLNTGEEQRMNVETPELSVVSINEFHPGELIVQYSDEEDRAVYRDVDLENQTLGEPVRFGEFVGNGPGWYFSTYSGRNETFLADQGNRNLYRLPGENLRHLDSAPGYALMYGPQELMLCDTGTGTICSAPADDVWTARVCGKNVVYADGTNGSLLWFWNTEHAVPEDRTLARLLPQDLEAANENLADKIESVTGMQVYYGEEGNTFNDYGDTGYDGDNCLDPLQTYLCLSQSLSLFEEYPAGVFQEMLVEETTDFKYFLVSAFHPRGEGTIGDAAAFAYNLGTTQTVAVDVDEARSGLNFRATLVHELMHVMENRILMLERDGGPHYLMFWESFLPQDQELYFYDYTNEDGSTISDAEYTAMSGLSPEEAYFLDGYSRTYPHEDRARILEYLYMGEDTYAAEYFRSGILQRKAQYLCAVIRECFPACGAAETLPWEKIIETVPFSEFEDQVNSYEPEAKG